MDLLRRTVKIDELLATERGKYDTDIHSFSVVNKLLKRIKERQRFMTPSDQLNILRLLKETQKFARLGDERAAKWQDFSREVIENIPVEFLNDYDLSKLQAFSINLTNLKVLDESPPESMLRWALTERYSALRPQLIEMV